MAAEAEAAVSVLSIQSHVTHGYVGNKAATLPMQLFGIDVDPIHVVEFSNHTGYKQFRGRRVPVKEIEAIVEGLRLNGFLQQYQCLLSGYIGNAETCAYVGTLVKELTAMPRPSGTDSHNDDAGNHQKNTSDAEAAPPVLYVCDPVLGDNGKLYVAEDVVGVYRNVLVPLAHVATPNGFEAQVLSGIPIDSAASAQRAAAWFHAQGVRRVVIKSFFDKTFDGGNGEAAADASPKWISFLTSEAVAHGRQAPGSGARAGGGDGGGSRHAFTADGVVQHIGRVPLLDGHYSGTGDLLAAILTSRILREPSTPFHDMVHTTMQSMLCVIQRTAAAAAAAPPDEAHSFTELRIVACRDAIVCPQMACDGAAACVIMERVPDGM